MIGTVGRNTGSAFGTSAHTVTQLMYAGDDEVQRINGNVSKAESVVPSEAGRDSVVHHREPSAELRLRKKVEEGGLTIRPNHQEQMLEIERREK